MSTLYHVTQLLSADEKSELASLLAEDDLVVFSQDGVYNQINTNNICYLADDIKSRAINLVQDNVKLISYTDWVDLASQFQTNIKW
ncbi:DsrH/TusB family sulfur metabolism protein [Catenovulum adriaticum]|uniref:DsrH/TusB family sulfur relay protein n=1 Tax=Catenovulum adriaticum TaxID=2984846 RepID=A0ABY7ARB6_9ALTE|nr:DsrH/TusB family sulfur metabolism protein [Catenovulum sp. TS8]WAJ70796.1 DsrH/TusB family sulfur relay protein [Catenovulum sp. TS8]